MSSNDVIFKRSIDLFQFKIAVDLFILLYVYMLVSLGGLVSVPGYKIQKDFCSEMRLVWLVSTHMKE